MGQITLTCSGVRVIMSTEFCAGRSRAKCRLSSRPSSISIINLTHRQGAWPRPSRRTLLARAAEVIE